MYPNEELTKVLAPAYAPCRHMSVHGGGCPESHWIPASGHVPRGFLGATGELDDVELVMVLAEPGDPKRTERYADDVSPRDMVRCVVDFVHGTYVDRDKPVHGKVQRAVRRFLDRWFCGMDFDQQLRRVWITQARLCSRSDGSYAAPYYLPCADTFLWAQLRLLPNVPIIAFGDKAYRSLRRRNVPATRVPHPSARISDESMRALWDRAIAKLRRREDPRASTYTEAPRPLAQHLANSHRQVDQRGIVLDRPQRHDRAGIVTPDSLPGAVAAFLAAAAKAGYEVRWGNRQNISLLYAGRWLGGWNYKAGHWYVRASALGDCSSLPRRNGFEPRRHGTLWQRSGKASPQEATDAFRCVINELMDVVIPHLD